LKSKLTDLILSLNRWIRREWPEQHHLLQAYVLLDALAALEAHHHISPSLEIQLVLELECWVQAPELVQLHPAHVRCRLPCPLHEELVAAMSQLSTDHFGRSGARPAVTKWGQGAWCGWQFTVERLEETDMKYIMNLGTLGQLQAIDNLTNLLDDSERAVELRTQLARILHLQRGDRPVQES
jgi:hypothetical protein